MTRRRLLVQAGAAGAAGVWLTGIAKGPLTGLAEAADFNGVQLRRSTYMGISSSAFTVVDGDAIHRLELIGVEDLAVAASVPALRDSDEAFSLRFRGTGADLFEQGTREMRHPDMGTFPLFLAPVEMRTDTQDYEAVIDRTVRIPGLEEDGSPAPVEPGERGSTKSARSDVGRARPAPRLRHARLRRAGSGRALLAEIALSATPAVQSIRASLLRRGRTVATATGSPRAGQALLRFAARAPRREVAYTLKLNVVDEGGQVTELQARLRLR